MQIHLVFSACTLAAVLVLSTSCDKLFGLRALDPQEPEVGSQKQQEVFVVSNCEESGFGYKLYVAMPSAALDSLAHAPKNARAVDVVGKAAAGSSTWSKHFFLAGNAAITGAVEQELCMSGQAREGFSCAAVEYSASFFAPTCRGIRNGQVASIGVSRNASSF